MRAQSQKKQNKPKQHANDGISEGLKVKISNMMTFHAKVSCSSVQVLMNSKQERKYDLI